MLQCSFNRFLHYPTKNTRKFIKTNKLDTIETIRKIFASEDENILKCDINFLKGDR